MFYALVLLSDKHTRRSGNVAVEEEDSNVAEKEEDSIATFDVTFDTSDLAEYLLDATDGMDREEDIVDGGTVQTSPLVDNMEILSGSDGGGTQRGRTRIRNPYKTRIRHHGGYELNKRKPPDGEP